MDDDDLARLVAVRVGVFLGGTPVRRPARVPYAVIAVERVETDRLLEISELTLGTAQRQMTIVIDHGNTRRVISAILELSQTVDDQRHDLFVSNVSDDSAHSLIMNDRSR